MRQIAQEIQREQQGEEGEEKRDCKVAARTLNVIFKK
jgi:hypothetical protein